MENNENKTDIFTVNGKEFDISTESGRGQLKGYLEATSNIASKKANETYQIKKTLGVAKDATLEEIKARINTAKSDGDTDAANEATQELANYQYQELERQKLQKIEDEWFAEYKAARPEIFESIPDALAKDALFGKYGTELHRHNDPVGFADQILNSYVQPSVTSPSGPLGPRKEAKKETKSVDKAENGPSLAELLKNDPLFKG